jgi:hypothetical protein
MEQIYRVVSRRNLPMISHADFSMPQEEFLLIRVEDGKSIRVSLSRRTQWQVGETVQIDDAVINANLIK